MTDISDLEGLTLTAFSIKAGQKTVLLQTEQRAFLLVRRLSDPASIFVESICGNIEDILNTPILTAEKITSRGIKPAHADDVTDLVLSRIHGDEPEPYLADSHTWTFYTLGTEKGVVTIRWLGQSNGFYSEEVEILEL
jgi:hypothetical protein